MKRIAGLAISLAVLAACTKAGTQAGSEGRTNAWTQPHVLRYATSEDLVGLNPHLNQQQTLSLMSSPTMAWLIKWDAKNRPYPELATAVPTKQNGGISADGKTITYHLRKDAKWSDGVPFNADDVVFSTEAVLNKANNEVGRAGWDLITKTDEPDKYTVVYHLRKPYSPFLPTFFSSAGANPCVLPKHILGKLPNINTAAYNSLPIGIGPYKYQSWKRGDAVTLVPNPGYFGKPGKLKKIVFKLIPNRDTVLSQLQTGEIDLWYPVPGSYFARIGDIKGVSFIRQPAYQYNHYDFNLTSPRLKELPVREALRYALDRETIRHKIGHDLGILQESPVSPAAPYAVNGIPKIPFDIAKANQILDGAGWKRGSDGIRSKNGVKLVLNVATSTGSQDVDQQIEVVRNNWQQIGVSMDVHHYLSSLLFAPLQSGGIIYSGKFDVVLFSWVLDPVGDLSNLFASDQIPPNGQNDMHWINHKADAAMSTFKSLFSFEARQPYEDTVVKEFVHDVPSIVSTSREDVYIFNKDLKDFHPNQVTPFDNIQDADI